jgi:hypothetical protein
MFANFPAIPVLILEVQQKSIVQRTYDNLNYGIFSSAQRQGASISWSISILPGANRWGIRPGGLTGLVSCKNQAQSTSPKIIRRKLHTEFMQASIGMRGLR